MKRALRIHKPYLAGLIILLALTPFAVAHAAPPQHDDFDNAVVVSALPFSDTLDTTEATTASDDPNCIGNGPTVWYAFTLTANLSVEANTFGSAYDTTLSVYTGTRGNLTQIICNDDAAGSLQSRVRFDATAGVTYYVMVGAYDSGPGGNLIFNITEAPPPSLPFISGVSINRTGSVKPQVGIAAISGTVTCSSPTFVNLYGDLEQKGPRGMVIRGYFYIGVPCSGQATWTAGVLPLTYPDTRFSPGQATATVIAFSADDGSSASATRTVTLTAAPQ